VRRKGLSLGFLSFLFFKELVKFVPNFVRQIGRAKIAGWNCFFRAHMWRMRTCRHVLLNQGLGDAVRTHDHDPSFALVASVGILNMDDGVTVFVQCFH
jgi:hypothetical protein